LKGETLLSIEIDRSFRDKIKENPWFNFERNEVFLLLSFFFLGAAFANYEPYASFWLSNLFKVESFLTIGLVFVIPSISVAIAVPFWGYLADKFGIKKFVIFGVAAHSVLFFSLIFATSSTYFLVAVLLGSLMGAAQSSNYYALGERVVNKPRTVIFAKMIAIISLSWVIMSPFTGWINDLLQEDAMKIQLILAVVLCSISLFITLLIKEEQKLEVGVKIEETSSLKIPKKDPLSFVPLLFIVILITVFTFQTTGGFWAYTSIYFLDTLNVKGVIYSVFLILKTALAIPIAVALGRVKKHNTNVLIILIVSSWAFISYLFMMLFPMNWVMFLLIYSIPMYPVYNVTYLSIVSRLTSEKRRATAFGITSALSTAGYVSGILILGLVADTFAKGIFVTLTGSMIFGIAATVVAGFFYIFNKKKSSKITTEDL
jgi:MFS family permease